jgi:2-oxoglutarate dehydrogenase E1 component
LVVMTPKSLLRHPDVVSPLDAFAAGKFQRLIPDDSPRAPEKITRILLCSGKIYYDLRKQRQEKAREDIAIIRLEQLYPLRREFLEKEIARYPESAPVFWVQEEPENMGAWRFMRVNFGDEMFNRAFNVISRPTEASPATGSSNSHKKEQEEILRRALE